MKTTLEENSKACKKARLLEICSLRERGRGLVALRKHCLAITPTNLESLRVLDRRGIVFCSQEDRAATLVSDGISALGGTAVH